MRLSTKVSRTRVCFYMLLAMLVIRALSLVSLAVELDEAAPAELPKAEVVQTTEVPVSQTEANINGRQVLTKVFEVSPDVDPESLKESGIVIGGYEYTLSSFTKETATKEATKSVTSEQTITLKSSNKNDAYVEALKELPQTIEYTEDGYAGEISLVASSVEVAETGRSSHKASDVQTKKYTLSYNDDSLVPATISVNGKTYTRTSLSWADGAYGPDGVMPENYIATAKYARSWSYESVDGYKATATYAGDVQMSNATMVRYTVEYTGTPISGNEPAVETKTAASASTIGVIVLLVALFGLMLAIIILLATGKVKFDAAGKATSNYTVPAETPAAAALPAATELSAGPEGTEL